MCNEEHSLPNSREGCKCIYFGLNLCHACREHQNTTFEGLFLPRSLQSTKHNGALISPSGL